eukprot:9453850-Karenia_brevis.AAC.1
MDTEDEESMITDEYHASLHKGLENNQEWSEEFDKVIDSSTTQNSGKIDDMDLAQKVDIGSFSH